MFCFDMQPPISVSSANFVQLAEVDGPNCGQRLVQVYSDCGDLSVIEGTVDGAGIGELIQKGR